MFEIELIITGKIKPTVLKAETEDKARKIYFGILNSDKYYEIEGALSSIRIDKIISITVKKDGKEIWQ